MSNKYIKLWQNSGDIHICCNVSATFAIQKNILAYQTIKEALSSLLDQECSASSSSSFNASLAFSFLVFLSFLEKCPGRRRVEEKDFQWVIQRHRVNASILFLTTSVNCRSDSPTHSTFLLEGEAETLRLKWDEECGKRCCSCLFLTPSPPLISPSPLTTWAKTLTRT